MKHLTTSPNVVIVVVLGTIVAGIAFLVIAIKRKLGKYKKAGIKDCLWELNIYPIIDLYWGG